MSRATGRRGERGLIVVPRTVVALAQGAGTRIHEAEWRATCSPMRWIFSANASVPRAALRKISCVAPYCGSVPALMTVEPLREAPSRHRTIPGR